MTDCFDIDKRSLLALKEHTIDYAFIDACYDERQTSGNHLNYIQASNILDELNVIDKMKTKTYLLFVEQRSKIIKMMMDDSKKFTNLSFNHLLTNYELIHEPYITYHFNDSNSKLFNK